MEVFIKDKDKNKYESFSLIGYYHTFRLGEEDTGKKNCLIQDIWSEDCEELPKLLVKSLEQHDLEIRADERNKVCERLEEWIDETLIYNGNWDNGDRLGFGSIVVYKDLQQKLNELKGE